MLALTLQYKVDIYTALCFPITSSPPSLCHLSGIIYNTDKAALLQYLVKKFPTNETKIIEDIIINDGFAFLYTLVNLPSTYGEISEYILHIINKQHAKTIDLIFDTYQSPSIKDYEHNKRDNKKTNFKILGRSQIRNKDFHQDLKDEGFKKAFVKFLINDWTKQDRKTLIHNKTIRINHDKCHIFKVNETSLSIESSEDQNLTSEHAEADSKIIQHACNFYQTNSENIAIKSVIKIRASDTDILVIMLGNMHEMLNKQNEVWMDCGVGQSQRLINITKMYQTLGADVCKALPGIHAFSGCDFNSCFYRKGKIKPLQLMMDNPVFCKAFIDVGDLTNNTSCNNYEVCIETSLFKTIEKFVCILYGYKKEDSLHNVRHQMFLKTYKNPNVNELLKLNITNFDPSNIPPCKSELYMHFLRTAFISNIWQSAYKGTLDFVDASKFGWKLVKAPNLEDQYDFNWFYGDQMPKIKDNY